MPVKRAMSDLSVTSHKIYYIKLLLNILLIIYSMYDINTWRQAETGQISRDNKIVIENLVIEEIHKS